MNELPKYKDWTIDLRLRQFRKVGYDENHSPLGIEMWDFDSEQGGEIFKEYCQERHDTLCDDANAYLLMVSRIEDKDFEGMECDELAEEMIN